MKGKSVTFRPKKDAGARLEKLAAAAGHSKTFHIENCIAAHLPALEKKYAKELQALAEKIKSRMNYPENRPQGAALNEGNNI